MPDLSARRLLALARHAVVFELRLYRSLARWMARRPDHGSPSEAPVTYARTAAPMMWLWTFASAVEIPIVHLLIPWEPVRLTLLVVGVWGVLWMVGLIASMRIYPHLLGPEALRVRHGAAHDVAVPWSEVASVSRKLRALDSSVWALQQEDVEAGTRLNLAVGGEVNVHLRLRRPTVLRTAKGDLEVVEVSLFADDAKELVAEVARRIAAAEVADGARRPG